MRSRLAHWLRLMAACLSSRRLPPPPISLLRRLPDSSGRPALILTRACAGRAFRVLASTSACPRAQPTNQLASLSDCPCCPPASLFASLASCLRRMPHWLPLDAQPFGWPQSRRLPLVSCRMLVLKLFTCIIFLATLSRYFARLNQISRRCTIQQVLKTYETKPLHFL